MFARSTVTIPILILVPALTLRSQAAHQGQRYCAWDDGRPFRITQDSVGPFSVITVLGKLRSACPGARDTLMVGEESYSPAVSFHFRGQTVVAAQQDHDSLESDDIADTWIIRGRKALLPQGVTMSSTWSALRAAYGPATGMSGSEVVVMFCKMPRMFFTLSADPESVGDVGAHGVSLIPDTTTIKEVQISPHGLGGWVC